VLGGCWQSRSLYRQFRSLYRISLNQLGIIAPRTPRDAFLKFLEHLLEHFIAQPGERVRGLDLVLTGHEQRNDFQIGRGMLVTHARDGLFAVFGEVPSQRTDEFLVQQITRAGPSSGRIPLRRFSIFGNAPHRGVWGDRSRVM
jgi:hypothetical protein